MNMFSRRSPQMVTQAEALGDNPTELEVDPTHFISGRSIKPPFPETFEEQKLETIVLAMGCFWGAERFFWEAKEVYVTAVGYSGGFTANPTYEQVCSGQTGHTEAVLVVYKSSPANLERVLKLFWENHDPTQPMGQGNDIGTQYRSGIYTTNADQSAAVEKSVGLYQHELTEGGFGKIETEISELGDWYYAETYHQQYLEKNPGGYCNHGFCQVRFPETSS